VGGVGKGDWKLFALSWVLLIRTSGVDAGDDFEHTILKCADRLFDKQQLGEYKSLTPTYLLKQDTSQLPDIDVSTGEEVSA
jgi:hypothetical protein